LQVVLGLDVARIASAFLSSPQALGQRLVRAKQKIRDAGIPFEIPERDALPTRLQDVLDGIYVAYGTGWDDIDGMDAKHADLTLEALQLGTAMVALMPEAAEPRGLLALMLFCDARNRARRTFSGDYVPLSEQNVDQWDHEKIARADALLIGAATLRQLGPYQLEAAIQSAHCQRRLGKPVASRDLLLLYDQLVDLRPSIGARVSRASVLAAVHGVQSGLEALTKIPAPQIATYQPYWAVRAHLLALDNQASAAEASYDRAIALASSASIKEYLWRRRTKLALKNQAPVSQS
ncbi:MAG: RNA polymerase sigma factor, partial [Gammaproteobacteria bacterium]